MSTPAISHGVPESILAAMRATNAIFDTELVNTGNFDLLDKVYTADATILLSGRSAMTQAARRSREFWKGAIAAMGVTAAKLATASRGNDRRDSVVEIGKAEFESWRRIDGRSEVRHPLEAGGRRVEVARRYLEFEFVTARAGGAGSGNPA